MPTMDVQCLLVAVAVGACVALVASAVILLVGGFGGYLRQTRAVNSLFDEVERVEGRLEREVKSRASLTKRDPLVDHLANQARLNLSGSQNVRDRRSDILRRSRGG